MKNSYFYSSIISFLAGIALGSFVVIPFSVSLFVALVSFCIFILLLLAGYRKSVIPLCIVLSLFSFALGVVRVHEKERSIPEIEKAIGTNIKIEGLVHDVPERRAKSTKIIILPEKINEQPIETKTFILVSADAYSDLAYGDRVSIPGTIKRPENFETESGATFDYISYLAKDGILYQMAYPKIEKISSGGGNAVKRNLFMLRAKFQSKIKRLLPAPENAFLNGILLGSKESFSEKLKQDFVTTGTVHLVALSGYNVTIVAETIMRFFSFLPLSLSSAFGIISIFLFAIMAGGGSTVFRASIMAMLVVAARFFGRGYDVGRALALAALVMVAINPKILIFDVSFQLSFLATLGIVYLSPKLEKRLSWITKKFGLREIISGTLAAQLATLPLIIYKTGVLSLIALPANMLLLPFVPLTMLFGFYAGMLGFISSIIAAPFAYMAYGLLHYELFIVKIFAAIPFAALTIKHVPIVFVLIAYALLAWWVLYKRKTAFISESSPH